MFSQVIIFILCNYVGCVDIIPIMLQNYYTGPIHPPYYALECRLHVRGNRVRKFFENYPMHNYWMNRSASLQYLRKIKSPKLILKWNSASILIEIEHLTVLKQNCFFHFFKGSNSFKWRSYCEFLKKLWIWLWWWQYPWIVHKV